MLLLRSLEYYQLKAVCQEMAEKNSRENEICVKKL